jgi:eukaryotic-like serine/threonine-protein kinase
MSSLSLSSYAGAGDESMHACGSASAGSVSLPKKLFGYEVVGFIGEGAGSRIYCVTEIGTGQLYALKHVTRKHEKDIRFVEQLEAEYAVGRHVVHPNLRKVIDLKINKTMLFKVTDAALVMELFDGITLESELPRSNANLIRIFIQTAEALKAMHTHGYIHCDLKPNNILYNTRFDVKVIDLGQACKVGTAKQRIQGTPDYISPEQVKCKPLMPQTDIYNLGATMYWCLAGRKMPTLYTIAKSKDENAFLSDDLITSPAQLNPMVPEGLSNFVMECVRLTPAKRPANMDEVVTRLELFHHLLSQREAGKVA